MFLVEKLPKESDKTSNEPTSKIDQLEKSIASVVARSLSSPWLPHYCHKSSRRGGYVNVPYTSVDIDVPSAKDGEGNSRKRDHCHCFIASLQNYFKKFLKFVMKMKISIEIIVKFYLAKYIKLSN